ncbi:MAG: hypothetical protein CSA66_01600 [Proteobacteria bacterium]|nr:MAG: hypothetical protein CSA66_01600 [Pseudomonadota bacterium]
MGKDSHGVVTAANAARLGVRGLGVDVRAALEQVRCAWEPVPPTLLGLAVAGVAAWGLWSFAEETADHIVYGLGAVALALVAVAVAVVSLAAFAVWLSLRRVQAQVPATLMVEIETTTSFRCPSLRYWPLVQVLVDWIDPAEMAVVTEADGGGLIERVTPRGRGSYEHVVRRFTVRDIFGFASISFRRTWAHQVRVVPAVGRADTTLAVRRATSEGWSHPSGKPVGELVEMRRYTYGDPMRLVVWKTFARDRNLMVREPERAIAPRPAMVGFFVAAEGDEPSACTARLFLEQGLLGQDFVFAADGAPRPTSNAAEALEQVIRSRAHRDAQGAGLAGLARAVDRSRLDSLVIFAPGVDGPWVDAVLAVRRRLPLPPMVVLTVDGRLATEPRTRLQRWLWERDEGTHPTLRDLPSIYDRLEAAQVDLRVIHRPSGRRLGAAEVDALRGA